MRKPKTDKLLKGIVGTSVALASLTGCGVTRHDLIGVPEYRTGTEVVEVPELPDPREADCDTWTWDEEAEGYQCAQQNSPRYGHYYYGGMWFPTLAAFMAGRATAPGVTNRSPNQQVTQPRTNPGTNTQVTQPRTGTNTQVTSPRSGMGSGGSYGG